MALTPQNNEAFLREVDEEYRRDQFVTFGRTYGKWIAVGVIAVLVAFGGYLYWQHHRREVAQAQGIELQLAYDKLGADNVAAAKAPLADLSASSIDGYRALATFTQADILLKDNNFRGAAAKFAEVAADDGLPQPYRDLALIRQTSAEFDTLKPDVVVARLRPLTAPGSAFLGSAGELVAMAYLEQGKKAEAGQLFARIAKDAKQPGSLRQRAVQMAGLLGVDAVGATEEK